MSGPELIVDGKNRAGKVYFRRVGDYHVEPFPQAR
jgi:hypothetical protein